MRRHNVILFGAGASAGAGSIFPHPPPIGTALFDELSRTSRITNLLPCAWKELFRYQFEEGMARLLSCSSQTYSPFQRDLARFLARFEPMEGNAYSTLLSVLGRNISKYRFASLNYDLLFERAALNLGLGVTYDKGKSGRKAVDVLKPHGSCNFLPDMSGIHMSGNRFENCETDVEVNGMVQPAPAQTAQIEQWLVDNPDLSPSMSAYAPGKPTKINRRFIESHRKSWSDSVLKAKEIFICGVQVNTADYHIWEPLQHIRGRITYINPDASHADRFLQWSQVNHRHYDRVKCVGFRDAIGIMAGTIH